MQRTGIAFRIMSLIEFAPQSQTDYIDLMECRLLMKFLKIPLDSPVIFHRLAGCFACKSLLVINEFCLRKMHPFFRQQNGILTVDRIIGAVFHFCKLVRPLFQNISAFHPADFYLVFTDQISDPGKVFFILQKILFRADIQSHDAE